MGFDAELDTDVSWPGSDFLREPETTYRDDQFILKFTRAPVSFLTAYSDATANTQRRSLSNLVTTQLRHEAVPPECRFYAIVYPEQFLPSVLSPESTARIQYKGARDRVVVVGFIDGGILTLKVTYPPDSGELIYATMETALELRRTVAELSNLAEQ